MDAFFVSVELLDQPELRGRPVVVGGSGDRGVVAAASYEARAHGVRSAMSSVMARKLCPHAVFLSGRYDRYVEISAQVMDVFHNFTPIVEPLSLDEAFLDLTGAEKLFGPPKEIGKKIRAEVLETVGLTCSVGMASTKFIAKLASEQAKPKASPRGPVFGDGVKVVPAEEILQFLHPLPVQALWGVGPATLAKLQRMGIVTVGDLANLPIENIVAALGKSAGQHLHDLANGIDDRVVVPDREVKSIGHEETFRHNMHDRPSLDRQLVAFADAVSSRLRAKELVGRTVQLKVKFGDFSLLTRSLTLPNGVDDASALLEAARKLLEQVDPSPGVRLLGLSVSGLSRDTARQLSFDDVLSGPSWPEASRTIDEIRARFGDDAIVPTTVIGPQGTGRKRRGQRQWGPDAEPNPEDDAS
ncbi:MAG: hypothetical protein RLZZ31_923 [Actinomycetota bacterium]